jgi:dsDNA-specific endonuclease/ATPase MutS2
MSVSSKRVETLRTIAAGAKPGWNVKALNRVDQEFQEAGRVARLSPEKRRHLLQVFHGMRGLESALKEVVKSHGFTPEKTLGRVLHQLNKFPASHAAHLNAKELNRFLHSIKDVRNRFMHEADSYPRTAREADQVLGEIAACLSLLVR